jgi:hypothetical protein
MFRIAISLPRGINKEETVVWPCILKLQEAFGEYCEIRESYGPFIDANRNKCVSKDFLNINWTKDSNFDHILFVDDDISFNINDFVKLLSHNKPIIAGYYQWRDRPQYGVAGGGDEKEDWSWEKTGVHIADFCGGGFLLVKREVFDEVKRPWFSHGYIGNSEGQLAVVGDDITFCNNASNTGYKIFIDCDCKVEHVFEKKQGQSSNTQTIQKLTEGASLTIHDIIKKTHDLQKSIYFLESALIETMKRTSGV